MKREKWQNYADRECLKELIERLRAFYNMPMVSEKKMRELIIAVEELYVNIVNYAYPDRLYSTDDKVICVQMEWKEREEKAVICLLDKGIAYNPLCQPAPELSSDICKRPIGGLGIYLAKKMTDELYYMRENNENKVTLIKKLSE